MKGNLHLSLSPNNFSKQLIQQQKQLCLFKVRKQMKDLNDPYNTNQISKALRNLQTQQQRKQLLDSIIKLREQKKQEEEKLKQLQLQKLWEKANHTNSKKLNTDYFYHRDLEDFESIKQQRFRFESERIENFYLRNEGTQNNYHRVSSLNCLTTEFVNQKKNAIQSTRRNKKHSTFSQIRPRDFSRNNLES